MTLTLLLTVWIPVLVLSLVILHAGRRIERAVLGDGESARPRPLTWGDAARAIRDEREARR